MAGSALMAGGIAAAILFATGHLPSPFAPVGALILLLAGASLFGKTSRFADKLQWLVRKNVRLLAWGVELPGTKGSLFEVTKIMAVGPGLHFYLRPHSASSAIHLKVAQPLEATISETGLEISHAKYIQWAGKKVRMAEHEKALVLSLVEDRS